MKPLQSCASIWKRALPGLRRHSRLGDVDSTGPLFQEDVGAGGAGWWSVAERLRAALAGAFHPLADSPFADIHSLGDPPPRSAFVLELPGLETSGFFLPAAPH
jgi:hypothetical protein